MSKRRPTTDDSFTSVTPSSSVESMEKEKDDPSETKPIVKKSKSAAKHEEVATDVINQFQASVSAAKQEEKSEESNKRVDGAREMSLKDNNLFKETNNKNGGEENESSFIKPDVSRNKGGNLKNDIKPEKLEGLKDKKAENTDSQDKEFKNKASNDILKDDDSTSADYDDVLQSGSESDKEKRDDINKKEIEVEVNARPGRNNNDNQRTLINLPIDSQINTMTNADNNYENGNEKSESHQLRGGKKDGLESGGVDKSDSSSDDNYDKVEEILSIGNNDEQTARHSGEESVKSKTSAEEKEMEESVYKRSDLHSMKMKKTKQCKKKLQKDHKKYKEKRNKMDYREMLLCSSSSDSAGEKKTALRGKRQKENVKNKTKQKSSSSSSTESDRRFKCFDKGKQNIDLINSEDEEQRSNDPIEQKDIKTSIEQTSKEAKIIKSVEKQDDVKVNAYDNIQHDTESYAHTKHENDITKGIHLETKPIVDENQESRNQLAEHGNANMEQPCPRRDGRTIREKALKETEMSYAHRPSSDEQCTDDCSEIAELPDDIKTNKDDDCETEEDEDVLGGQLCPSCRDQYEYPILLNCGHTFCRECVSLLVENSSDGLSFQCPTCSTDTSLTAAEEELFCPNFILLEGMRRRKYGDIGCASCKKKQADAICEDCVELYCAECLERHRQRKLTKDHRISDISSVEDPSKLKKRYFCPKHRKKQLTEYCLSCDVSICIKCAAGEHSGKNHDCGPVADAAEASRQILISTAENFETNQPDVAESLENVSAMMNGLDTELAEMKDEIKNSIENLIKSLREQESRLYDEVERKHQTIRNALLLRKQKIESSVTDTREMAGFLRELQQHNNDIEMLQMAATISRRNLELEEIKQQNDFVVDYDFMFSSNEDQVKREIKRHGHIEVRDRISGNEVIVNGFSDVGDNYGGSECENEALKTWSPTERRKDGDKNEKRHRNIEKEIHIETIGHSEIEKQTNSKDDEGRHFESEKDRNKVEDKDMLKDEDEKKIHRELPVDVIGSRHIEEACEMNARQINKMTAQCKEDKKLPIEQLTRLISERGEDVRNLRFNVRNHKDEACEVDVKMICPDKSIVSAHVAENADGAFTVFFCPEIKKDFNCYISIGGKHFKKEHRVLNFYGNFQGMRSKEIDLACRTIGLLRWHITPGLLEKKNGLVRRSRKFLKMKKAKK
eukprot:gene19274-21200_t